MFCTSVSLSVFLPEQPHQTEQDGSRHHQQTENHCRRNREVNAGLNDGRVGDACELLRRDVGLPALHGGKQYILDNWEKYSFHHLSEMVHTALEQWSISGELPAKQNH